MDNANIIKSAVPRFTGQPIKRKEDKRFLTGRGRYVDDLTLPGMLHAAVLRSPVARARIAEFDASEALDLPGVIAVYAAEQINPKFRTLLNTSNPEYAFGVDTVLADGVVSYVGDPVAVVIAEDRYIAEDAMELIMVDYDLIDPVITMEQAESEGPCLPGKDSNIAFQTEIPFPGVDDAFAAATHVTRGRIHQPRMMPTPMEARGIIVDPRMAGQLDLHMTSQNPYHTRKYIAEMMDIAENDIRIQTHDVGGGFGQKFSCGRDYLAVIAAAQLADRPVKWIEDRSEALIAGGFGRKERLTLDIAFDDAGQMKATSIAYEDNCGAEAAASEGVGLTVGLMHTNAYDIPLVKVKSVGWWTNTGPTIALRGPWAGETLVREITIDRAARELGRDPVELRRQNIIRTWPHTLPMQLVMDGVTPLECLDIAVEKIGYEDFREKQAAAREQGRYLGIGFAVCIEPTALTHGESEVETCTVRVDTMGKITANVSCTSQGHSIETTFAQVVADELGVDVADVTIQHGDTASVGWGMGAGGSRQGVIGGGAAKLAGAALRDKVLKIAAHMMQCQPSDLSMEGGRIVTASGASMSLAEVADAAYITPSALPEGTEPGLAAQYSYATGGMTFANAVHACIVEVDIATGLVSVDRYLVAEDCGVLLNPAVVEGQVAGGVVQGISNILWETQQFDENGTPSASTFKDYALPLACDIPLIEFHHLCTPSNTPTGAKGVGEGGMIVAAPACYNAVMDALAPFGAEIEELPLTPSRIVAAVQAGKQARAGA